MKKSLLLFVILTPAMIFVGLRSISVPFFSPQQHQCMYDITLSDEYTASINNLVTELLKNNSTPEIINQLQQQFPILKKITIAYQPMAVRVILSVHEPICNVNNLYVLTNKKDIFSKTIFSEEIIADMPCIMVMQDDVKDMTCFISHLLEILPSDVFHVYNVELVNEHYVRLIDKQQSKFTVISSVVQEKLPFLLSQCEAVKYAIAARKDFDKGAKWIADTRFAHYIVTYKA